MVSQDSKQEGTVFSWILAISTQRPEYAELSIFGALGKNNQVLQRDQQCL
jgi:hypothetical protein